MGKRDLVTAALLTAALIFAVPSPAAGVDVLLLPDSDSLPLDSDSYGPGTDALVAALKAAGHSVVVGPIEYEWNGSNPPTSGFDVVVHLNGKTWTKALPVAGQQALVEFVRSGGGYVGGQWNGFEAAMEYLTDMDDLVLQLWWSLDSCAECTVTWTVVPGQENHPMLEGIPGFFAFFAGGYDSVPQVVFDEFPSVVLMTSPGGGPAVTVRQLEGGRVVAFSSAANYLSELTLQDDFIQLLYTNAVSWAAAELSAPTFGGLAQKVAELEESGAINKGQANSLMSKLDAAARQFDRGNFGAAEKQMWLFVNKVESWIRREVLTPEKAEPLMIDAFAIIAYLVS